MEFFPVFVALAILLCGLVTGLVFAFAVVVMPGIATLDDREFLQAFQRMDAIIQKNDLRFMLVWVGSVLAIVTVVLLAVLTQVATNQVLAITAGVLYLFCVQLPTIKFNIPLNNTLQTLDLENLSGSEIHKARKNFEARWLFWNRFRCVFSLLTTLLLIIVSVRL